jgi:hypothetical protein
MVVVEVLVVRLVVVLEEAVLVGCGTVLEVVEVVDAVA